MEENAPLSSGVAPMPHQTYRYRIVDVFTDRPLEGNALAVFPDARDLDGSTMQKIAREMNLSETTFVTAPTRSDCVANVRIFTPHHEMRFAGHPTIGTAFVLLDEGSIGSREAFALEEQIGAVPIRVEYGERAMIWLATPPIDDGPTFDRAACARVLGLTSDDLLDIAPQLLSAGNPTLYIALTDKDAVDRAWLDGRGGAELEAAHGQSCCVFVFTPTADGAYSRMFAPHHGIAEDPATGSSTGPLARYMMRHGLASSAAETRFVSEQGTKMGRRSLLHVRICGEWGIDAIEVGGRVVPLADATLRL
jgi:trans-2,3-dihydro-3-hydroxyanthranilate isomerase